MGKRRREWAFFVFFSLSLFSLFHHHWHHIYWLNFIFLFLFFFLSIHWIMLYIIQSIYIYLCNIFFIEFTNHEHMKNNDSIVVYIYNYIYYEEAKNTYSNKHWNIEIWKKNIFIIYLLSSIIWIKWIFKLYRINVFFVVVVNL